MDGSWQYTAAASKRASFLTARVPSAYGARGERHWVWARGGATPLGAGLGVSLGPLLVGARLRSPTAGRCMRADSCTPVRLGGPTSH